MLTSAIFPSWVQLCLFCCTTHCVCTILCSISVKKSFSSNISVCSLNGVQHCLFPTHHTCCLFYQTWLINFKDHTHSGNTSVCFFTTTDVKNWSMLLFFMSRLRFFTSFSKWWIVIFWKVRYLR